MLWIAAGAGVLIGLVLLALGVRGRRVDAHPVCGKCRFDLAGLNRSACPECGADVAAAGAVRIGNRRKRRGAIVLGAVVLLAGIGGASALSWGAATKFNWNTVKPAWWLTRELRSADAKELDAAATELLARASAKKLETGAWPRIVSAGLAVQGVSDGPWAPSLGNLLEAARVAGAMDERMLRRYIEQGVSFAFEARPKVKFGVDAATRLNLRPLRTGDSDELKLRLALVEIAVDGEVIERHEPGSGGSFVGLSVRGSSSTGWSAKSAGLAPGEHRVRQRWVLSLQESFKEHAPSLSRWEREFETTFELLPEGQSTVALVKDEALRQEIAQKITLRDMRLSLYDAGRSRSRPQAYGMADLKQLPAHVSFDVVWRVPDGAGGFREVVAGSVCAEAGVWSGSSFGRMLTGSGFDAEKVDVILRVSPEAAERTVDMTEIWDGEIEIRDVPIEVSGGSD